jgi:hypothetical protein
MFSIYSQYIINKANICYILSGPLGRSSLLNESEIEVYEEQGSETRVDWSAVFATVILLGLLLFIFAIMIYDLPIRSL